MLIALVSIGLRFVSCPPLFVYIPYWYDLVGYRLIRKLAYRFGFHWSLPCELSTVVGLHFLLVPLGRLSSYQEACLSLLFPLVSGL